MAPLPEHLMPVPVGRSKLPREVMAEHQRDRIVEAAIGVFAKRGYQGTTIDHIVVAARIGVGSFYELFGGKEDCFLQVYDRVIAEARERIAARIPPGAAWPQATCAALGAVLELAVTEPLWARLALVEVQTAGEPGLARYEATLAAAAELLRRGRELSAEAAALPASLEVSIIGGLAWFLNQRLVLGELDEIEPALPELLRGVLEPYLGEAEAARLSAAQRAGAAPS